MKINISRLSKNLLSDVKAILFYGTNGSKISKGVEDVIKYVNVDEFNLINKKYKDIKGDSSLLYADLHCMSFGGCSLVRVTNIEEGITKDIKDIVKNYEGDNYVVFIGGNLSIRSEIRKFFETEKNLLAVCAYENSFAEAKAYAMQCMKGYGRRYEEGVLDILAEVNDSKLIDMEIGKLVNFVDSGEEIREYDAVKVVKNRNIESIDEMCVGFGNVDFGYVMKNLDILLLNGNSEVVIVRYMLRYFARLLQARRLVQGGMSVQSAMDKLKPKVFYKYQRSFAKHVDMWGESQIIWLLSKLVEIEIWERVGI